MAKKAVQRFWIVAQVVLVLGIVGFLGKGAVHQWKTSSYLRVSDVFFTGDIPADLPTAWPIKRGDSIISFQTAEIQQAALKRFPELQNLSVRRQWNRRVLVHGEYRPVVALVAKGNVELGMDGEGILFPIHEGNKPTGARPVLRALSERSLPVAASFLSTIERDVPKFYSLIKMVETDKMNAVHFTLVDDVVVHWGPMNEGSLSVRVDNFFRFLNRMQPVKTPATLRFVADDRIVMDEKWIMKGEKIHEGGDRV